MAASKTAPGGTVALPDNPELAHLKDREQAQMNEIARLEKMDANRVSQAGHDLIEVKRLAQIGLTEIRKEIQEATK